MAAGTESTMPSSAADSELASILLDVNVPARRTPSPRPPVRRPRMDSLEALSDLALNQALMMPGTAHGTTEPTHVCEEEFQEDYSQHNGKDEVDQQQVETLHTGQLSSEAVAFYDRRHSTMLMATHFDVESNTGIVMSAEELAMCNRDGRIGIYEPAERAFIIERFMSKRARRHFNKTIRYGCRKNLADRRIRVKGRFVRAEVAASIAVTAATAAKQHAQQQQAAADETAAFEISNAGAATVSSSSGVVANPTYLPLPEPADGDAVSSSPRSQSPCYGPAAAGAGPSAGATTAAIDRSAHADLQHAYVPAAAVCDDAIRIALEKLDPQDRDRQLARMGLAGIAIANSMAMHAAAASASAATASSAQHHHQASNNGSVKKGSSSSSSYASSSRPRLLTSESVDYAHQQQFYNHTNHNHPHHVGTPPTVPRGQVRTPLASSVPSSSGGGHGRTRCASEADSLRLALERGTAGPEHAAGSHRSSMSTSSSTISSGRATPVAAGGYATDGALAGPATSAAAAASYRYVSGHGSNSRHNDAAGTGSKGSGQRGQFEMEFPASTMRAMLAGESRSGRKRTLSASFL